MRCSALDLRLSPLGHWALCLTLCSCVARVRSRLLDFEATAEAEALLPPEELQRWALERRRARVLAQACAEGVRQPCPISVEWDEPDSEDSVWHTAEVFDVTATPGMVRTAAARQSTCCGHSLTRLFARSIGSSTRRTRWWSL